MALSLGMGLFLYCVVYSVGPCFLQTYILQFLEIFLPYFFFIFYLHFLCCFWNSFKSDIRLPELLFLVFYLSPCYSSFFVFCLLENCLDFKCLLNFLFSSYSLFFSYWFLFLLNDAIFSLS